MADKNNFYEAIDDFLFGRLEEEKEKSFRQALEADSELAKAVALRKDLHDGMKEGGRRALKEELDGIYTEIYESEKTVPKEAKVKKLNPWRQILLVASLVLFGLFAWWLWPQQTQSAHPILAKHYQPFKPNLIKRGAPADQDISEASQLYFDQKYKAAIPRLENALTKPTNEELFGQLRLALANAYFENGETEKAFQPLKQIIESNDLFLSDQARWYLALFHLQLHQSESAIPYLQFLANKNGADKSAEAQKILSQIK